MPWTEGRTGHHASCSCAIGPRAAGGVLDSSFRTYRTTGLREVDAPVFPRIPAFFIVNAGEHDRGEGGRG